MKMLYIIMIQQTGNIPDITNFPMVVSNQTIFYDYANPNKVAQIYCATLLLKKRISMY